MTNIQLTDKRTQLRTAAQNYQIALAWYQSNIDSPAALQAWDAATAELMAAIGNRETDIIADLLNEIAELQEHRKAAVEPIAWINEDDLPDNYPYDEMFQHSKVDIVRLFPVYAPQSLNDAERAELQERREAMKPLAGIDLESAVDRLAENCNSIQGAWCSDKRSAYYSGFRDGAAIGLNAEKNGSDDE